MNKPKTIRIDAHVLADVETIQKWMKRKGKADVSYSDAIREIIRLACENEDVAARMENKGRFIDPQQTRLVLLPKEEKI